MLWNQVVCTAVALVPQVVPLLAGMLVSVEGQETRLVRGEHKGFSVTVLGLGREGKEERFLPCASAIAAEKSGSGFQ